MADKKISALTASSTPLAGTEVLPIVQSGATVKVAVSDLTAGRAMSATSIALNGAASALTTVFIRNGAFSCSPFGADKQMATFGSYNDNLTNGGVTISALLADVPLEVGRFKNDGNYVPSAAAKGVNFTANTPAAGMTSQLLNWYEEGTWTPTFTLLTVVGTPTYTAWYTRVGRLVTVCIKITSTSSTSSTYGVTTLDNLPFAQNSSVRGNLPFLVDATGADGICTIAPGSPQIYCGSWSSAATVFISGSYFI